MCQCFKCKIFAVSASRPKGMDKESDEFCVAVLYQLRHGGRHLDPDAAGLRGAVGKVLRLKIHHKPNPEGNSPVTVSIHESATYGSALSRTRALRAVRARSGYIILPTWIRDPILRHIAFSWSLGGGLLKRV
jgi:hypothetical protein